MKFFTLLTLVYLVAFVTAYGVRGAWERLFFYYAYLAEEIPDDKGIRPDYTIGSKCVGSRLGKEKRCTLYEFVQHIWKATEGLLNEKLDPPKVEGDEPNRPDKAWDMRAELEAELEKDLAALSDDEKKKKAEAKMKENKIWIDGGKFRSAKDISKWEKIEEISLEHAAGRLQAGKWTQGTDAQKLYKDATDWYDALGKIGNAVKEAKAREASKEDKPKKEEPKDDETKEKEEKAAREREKIIIKRAITSAENVHLFRLKDMDSYRLKTIDPKKPIVLKIDKKTEEVIPIRDLNWVLHQDPAFIAALGDKLKDFKIKYILRDALPGDGGHKWRQLDADGTKAAYSYSPGFAAIFDAATDKYSTFAKPATHFQAIEAIKKSLAIIHDEPAAKECA